MRRKLILRFLLAYVLITVCIQALSGSAWIILRGLGIWRFDTAPSLRLLLQDFLDYLGQNLTALLLPGMDLGAVIGVLLSAGILFAGALLFARGPAREYRRLCEKAAALADTPAPQVQPEGRPDMERGLEAIAARLAGAQSALQACHANNQEALLLLDAARTQIEVLVEAGALAQGSAQAALVQEALAKIERAQRQISQ